MLVKNSSSHYGQVARLLHWTSVGLLVTVVYISSLFGGLEEGIERSKLVAEHVSYGLLLLIVMSSRFFWRQVNTNPILSYTIHPIQKRLAVSVHWLIYAALIFQTAIGIAQVAAAGGNVHLFGMEIVGKIGGENGAVRERLNDVHLAIANLVYIVLSIHILAALYHQVFGVLDFESDVGG